MKKQICVLIALTLCLGLFTGCRKSTAGETPTPAPSTNADYTPVSILAGTLARYQKDDVVFYASLDMVVDLEENSDMLQTMLYVPADQIGNITGASTVQHMNPNSFTGAVLEMKSGVDVNAFASTMRETILNTQWMCGFPEKLLIATVSDRFVVIAYGLDNGDAPLISTFQTRLKEAHGDSAVTIKSVDNFQ